MGDAIKPVSVAFEHLERLLLKANMLIVPTVSGWTATVVQAGSTSQVTGRLRVSCGATANGSALLTVPAYGFGKGLGDPDRMTWDSQIVIVCNLSRITNEAESVARFQLKEVTTIGALGAKGIGLRIDNLALVGESYGTQLGTVDLGTSLTLSRDARVVIVHTPSVPRVEWFVNGVLTGTQSTAANIPSGFAGGNTTLAVSIANGATGGVDADLYCNMPFIWQAR